MIGRVVVSLEVSVEVKVEVEVCRVLVVGKGRRAQTMMRGLTGEQRVREVG